MRFRYYVRLVLLLVSIVAAAAADSAAQDGRNPNDSPQNGKNLIREWIRTQRSALQHVQSFSVSETVHSTIDTGAGQRNFRLVSTRTASRSLEDNANDEQGQPDRFRMQREILQLVANGQEISSDRASIFFRMQRRMIRPEFARLLDTFHFPIQEATRWQSDVPLQMIERGGTYFWRLDGFAFVRPPVGPPPPDRDFPQDSDPGSDVDDRSDRPPRQKTRITAWFTTDTFRLHASLAKFPLPGRLSLSVRTTYSSEGALDVPVNRVVEGTIPMRRRNRAFAVRIKQTTDFSDYEINSN